MAKHMCKLSQSVRKNFETMAAILDNPRFLCTDCGRAANEKKRLCEPKRLPGVRRGRTTKSRPAAGAASEE